jgi:hypothetical protein
MGRRMSTTKDCKDSVKIKMRLKTASMAQSPKTLDDGDI